MTTTTERIPPNITPFEWLVSMMVCMANGLDEHDARAVVAKAAEEMEAAK